MSHSPSSPAILGSPPPSAVATIVVVARKEIRDALRNRWFVLYTIAFTVLAAALSSLSLAGSGSLGFAGYGRTAASLINLIILIVPLMALTAGAGSVAAERERGTLGYLLAQPVSRFEVLTGKYTGLGVALLAALAIGFGVSAVLMAFSQRVNALDFAALAGRTGLLALAMLAVGMLVSTCTRKASAALGVVIFLWLALVFVGDLGLMGSTLVFKLQVSELFGLSLLNPMQVFKMSVLESIDASLDVLGPAGLYATSTYGRGLPWIFGGVLAAWTLIPLTLSYLLFIRRGEP